MSIFGTIMNKIFGASPAAAATSAAVGSSPAAASPSPSAAAPAAAAPTLAAAASTPAAAPAAPAAAPLSQVDVEAVLTQLASQNKEKLDWRKSIVDLMKLLKLDSGLGARKELAKELGYTGDTNDSAKMNIWLHKQVMTKLAANGGKVPADLQ
jgi:3-oxoacyl-ACP reductase-like protein